MNYYIIFILSVIQISCKNEVSSEAEIKKLNEYKENYAKIDSSSSINCNEYLKKFVSSTNIKDYNSMYEYRMQLKLTTKKDDINVTVERLEDTTASVHVTFENEDGRDATIAWIELSLNKLIVKDITFDIDSPTYLTFDTSILIDLQKRCLTR